MTKELNEIIKQQKKTNDLLTILIGILTEEEDADGSAPTYLSGHPRENSQAKSPSTQD